MNKPIYKKPASCDIKVWLFCECNNPNCNEECLLVAEDYFHIRANTGFYLISNKCKPPTSCKGLLVKRRKTYSIYTDNINKLPLFKRLYKLILEKGFKLCHGKRK